jgi:hypothetical protein
MIDLGPLVNKAVDFAYCGARLRFELSHALFSSFDVDSGTRLLLKELAHEPSVLEARSILDAGCGVGIIGLSLAAARPGARVVMRDRDLLACAFTERNCRRNHVPAERLDIDGSTFAPEAAGRRGNQDQPGRKKVIVAPGLLGEEDPLGPYEAVLSNLPAKAGPEILSRFLKAAAGPLLVPGGCLAFVIVNTLSGLVEAWTEAAGLSLARKSAGPGHTVFVLKKAGKIVPASDEAEPPTASEPPAVLPEWVAPSGANLAERARGLDFYVRSSGPRSLGRYYQEASGYQGLPEFDTNSFATDLGIEALERAAAGSLVRDFLAVEPGIGLASLWACRSLGPERVHALSRDYLALIATAANLAASFPKVACQPLASTEAGELSDASIDAAMIFPDITPRVDSIPGYWQLLSRTAKRGAAVVVAADSQTAFRFDKAKIPGFRRSTELKKKGWTALAYIRD